MLSNSTYMIFLLNYSFNLLRYSGVAMKRIECSSLWYTNATKLVLHLSYLVQLDCFPNR